MGSRICFDSSVWNAILNNETHRDLFSIQAWVAKVEKGEARLLVPSIVICEIAAHPDVKQVILFEQMLNSVHVEQLDITTPIAKKAGELRRLLLANKLKIKTPDALIIAASDYHKANYIFSFDDGILRCNGKYNIAAEKGLPSKGHNQPLLP